jgi:hypothetical protein
MFLFFYVFCISFVYLWEKWFQSMQVDESGPSFSLGLSQSSTSHSSRQQKGKMQDAKATEKHRQRKNEESSSDEENR